MIEVNEITKRIQTGRERGKQRETKRETERDGEQTKVAATKNRQRRRMDRVESCRVQRQRRDELVIYSTQHGYERYAWGLSLKGGRKARRREGSLEVLLLMSINLSAVINNHLEMQQQRQLLLPSVRAGKAAKAAKAAASQWPLIPHCTRGGEGRGCQEDGLCQGRLLSSLSLSSQLLEVCPLDI